MSNPLDYAVGWICAIATEYVAAQAFLDERHEGPEYVSPNDNNDYTLGKVGKHNVVIAVLPDGEYGSSTAASVARDMLYSFPNIRIGLLVGIGGGVPSSENDIRLGDIIVGASRDGSGGVFQYDFGRTIQDQKFQVTGFLNQSPTILRTAVSGLKAQYEADGHQLEEAINGVLEKKRRLQQRYKRPHESSDKLYKANIIHPSNNEANCTSVCSSDSSYLITRPKRTYIEDNPAIHYGLIASGNQLMEDALIRDALAMERGVLCFDMTAAGLMNHFSCLVVRGICDYSDSHKNEEWQGFAAMAAAAYAKDILYRISPNRVEAEQSITSTLSCVPNSVSATQFHIETIKSSLGRNEDFEILNWLAPIDYKHQQSDYFGRRQGRTGQWLIDSKEFQIWLKRSHQTLFCPGIPGAGKTILTSLIIQYLTLRYGNNEDVGVAFVYCNFRRHDEQKVEDLLASLLKQLSRGQPSLPASVKSLYEQHKTKRTRPTLKEISSSLWLVSAIFSRTFIIVDALDECQVSNGCRKKFLEELFKLQKNGINLFATSRFIPEIMKEFTCSLVLEIRASDDDIGEYVSSQIFQLPVFVSHNIDLQEEIRNDIIASIDGMFLLAQLYIQELGDKMTPKDMRTALKQLSRQQKSSNEYEKFEVLSQAYSQAMERIESQGKGRKELAIKVLLWITCAKRPLTTLELQHALAVEVQKYELDIDNMPDIEDMVSVCAGLVVVDLETHVIRLVHYTAQEYFEKTQGRWFPNAEDNITTICISYLSHNTFAQGVCQSDNEFEHRLQSNPFFKYAAHNWGHHARNSSMTSPIIQQVVSKFLNEKDAYLYASLQAKFIGSQNFSFSGYSQNFPKHMTIFHILAYFGVDTVMALMLRKGDKNEVLINLRDSYRQTPLTWAAKLGHVAVVELLLSTGMVNFDFEVGRTPLWFAAAIGQDTIVKLLLDTGKIDFDMKILASSHTPLSVAASNGHTAVVKLLLDTEKVNIESKAVRSYTPLLFAAKRGHTTVVKLLLERGANPNSRNSKGQTPLMLASRGGYDVIVNLLLKQGASVSQEDYRGKTPLEYAIENGCEDTVKILLGHGAKANLEKNERTPLELAIINGSEVIVKLLLDHGANINPENSRLTPLELALKCESGVLMKLLLERGAKVDFVDNW